MNWKVPRPPWLLAILIAFLLLGAAGFTGSSGLLPTNNCLLLGKSDHRHSTLFGQPRHIRIDEWSVELPLQRAQQLAEPSFPLVNLNVGLGQLQRNSFPIPVLDWGVVFRPLLWPVLGGTKWGFGLRWFARNALLLLGLVLWLRALSARRGALFEQRRGLLELSAVAGVAVFLSSAVTWWMSSPLSELLAYASVATALGRYAMLETRLRHRAAWTAGSWYLLCCAFFVFYPPVWAPMLWVMCATFADISWREGGGWRRMFSRLLQPLGLVFTAVACSVLYYSPYLLSILHTAYPGERRAVSGAFPLERLFSLPWPSVGIVAPSGAPEKYLALEPGNVCEFSAIESLPIALLLGLTLLLPTVRSALCRTVRSHPVLTFAVLLLGVWQFVPGPDFLGKVALLRWSPQNRAWFAFGLGLALFTFVWLSQLKPAEERAQRRSLAVALAAVILVAVLLPVQQSYWPKLDGAYARQYAIPMMLAGALLLAGVVWLPSPNGRRLLVLGWALPLIVANHAVNPITHSSKLLANGQGHAVLREQFETKPGRVVEYSNHLGVELVGEGFPTLGGVHAAPDLDLFRFLMPETPGLTEFMVNRYAHVQFGFPRDASQLFHSNFVRVSISPCSERLKTLWVNHFLAYPAERLPKACAADFDVSTAGYLQLWTRKIAVQPIGVARRPDPKSALDFDFQTPNAARLRQQRDGIVLEAPPGTGSFATALNLSLIDQIDCDGATASTLDAHVVIEKELASAARCEVKFIGTRAALTRLVSARR